MADEDLRVFIDSTGRGTAHMLISDGVEPVNVVTCDGRIIVGLLKSFDQAMNLVLSHTHERVFSLEAPVGVSQLGIYLVRGDNVAVVGEIDEDADSSVDYESLKAAPLAAVLH